MRDELDFLLDLSEPHINRDLRSSIVPLKGWYKVTLTPKRPTRSTRANAYYWAAVVTPFFGFLRDQDPCVTEREQAHIEIKRNVLGTRPVNVGGAVCRIVPSTHDMDAAAFADFVDRARHWLREKVGLDTMDPEEYGADMRRADRVR